MKKYIIAMAATLVVGCASNQPQQFHDLLYDELPGNYAEKSETINPDDGKKGPFPPG